ncbi:MAG: 1-(5-phosphoribosyl)-5-[(5-phosphoribosylamino)methylideneamino]imidazole-4-carboxamide isomerase [Candidatus Omnitrophica bacterium]|nr:1-(5-phosphoribosyl)-5-[(5-phosphoribosylamino)methylideneamino]imidazole-4-carboxamide isomerase [Candidatus Omnitrophota bacterium]
MIIIPAIDLIEGKVVRLEQGDYKKVKVYSDYPADIAKQWRDKGAKLLHVVDLDGARTGELKNLKSAEKIVREAGIKIELGGGIRDSNSMKRVFDAGISIAVLGTSVLKDREFATSSLKEYSGYKIVFGIDTKGKDVLVEGWFESSGFDVNDLIKDFALMGLKRIIYTDITRDGMMSGPNLKGIKNILSLAELEVIASGGVSDIDDVKRLKELEKDGLIGAIIGKALYEGKIKLDEAIKEAK